MDIAMEPHFYMTVAGLPSLICCRMPPKVPHRRLLPALTQVARDHGCRQKDISFLETVAKDGEKESVGFQAAFAGGYRLKKFELREWDAESNSLVKVRSCLHDSQAEFAEWSAKFSDRSTLDMRLPKWALSRFARVDQFDIEDCRSYFAEQERVAGFDEGAGGFFRKVVALRSGDELKIIDGKDRVAAAEKSGDTCVLALIGEIDDLAVSEYSRRVGLIPSLKNMAGVEFTFYGHASLALAESGGDCRKVDWIGVDESVLYESIVQHHQPYDVACLALKRVSPSALFPGRCEQLELRASEVNRLASRIEVLNGLTSGFEPQ